MGIAQQLYAWQMHYEKTQERITKKLSDMRDSGKENQKQWPKKSEFWLGWELGMEKARQTVKREMEDD